MTRLWDKGAPLDDRVLVFTAGEDYALDERLVRYDVQASIAHAEMLNAQKLLSDADLQAIRSGLQAIAQEHADGKWRIELNDEDGQTALEKRLTARIGEAGGRVHLGRSRNDQVLTALRLYLRDAVTSLSDGAARVADALDRLAQREQATLLPGYTHMQQAMPSSVTLWAGGFAAEIRDDAEGIRLSQRRLGKSPLGSAAGYGTPGLPLDRKLTASKLGFSSGAQEPVTSVQLSRGKAEAQILFETALLMQDLGRLAADVLLFYTQEFAFVSLPDAFTTGSSIMPQKRNPDVFELIRGRSATALACLHEALGICAKLPSGYQRDLQLLKVPLFRGIDIASQTLDILPPAIDAMKFRPENITLDPAIHAAEEANALVVKEGIPFREAYRRVGAALKAAVAARSGGEGAAAQAAAGVAAAAESGSARPTARSPANPPN
jgi:argininosuccinate lyase